MPSKSSKPPKPSTPSSPSIPTGATLSRLRHKRADLDVRYRQATYKGDAAARCAHKAARDHLDDEILWQEVQALYKRIIGQFQTLHKAAVATLDRAPTGAPPVKRTPTQRAAAAELARFRANAPKEGRG